MKSHKFLNNYAPQIGRDKALARFWPKFPNPGYKKCMDTNKGSRTDVLANRVAGKPFSRRRSSNVLPISVFPYPGSKQWFLPRAAQFFRAHQCQTLIEPFAGSGVVGLSLLHAGIIKKLVLVEKYHKTASILQAMLDDPELADRYAAFECTRTNVENLIRNEESAFRYLVHARCCYSGRFDLSLDPQIDRHFCREKVVASIRRVHAMRDAIVVIHGDAFAEMPMYAADRNVGCFADPPYTADPRSRGRMLYRHHKLHHQKLFSLLAGWHGPWLLTEDNSRMVRRLALCYRFHCKRVPMKTATNEKKKELMISRRRRVF
jgi:site-specific DNA-adenine methylase